MFQQSYGSARQNPENPSGLQGRERLGAHEKRILIGEPLNDVLIRILKLCGKLTAVEIDAATEGKDFIYCQRLMEIQKQIFKLVGLIESEHL